ncbi:glycosyltransferase family A protein [Helicobacter mustelae]|nr:glycosyltransferase family A protein [Helicobacter mustelae]SQH71285.1 Uncharacterised protein [Helicobacter mustelae]
MEKLIACIIPFYNVADFLDTCIQSCLNQTHKNPKKSRTIPH